MTKENKNNKNKKYEAKIVERIYRGEIDLTEYFRNLLVEAINKR